MVGDVLSAHARPRGAKPDPAGPEPQDLPEEYRKHGFFVEVFSGTAHLTLAMRALGIMCLPPIDKEPDADWFVPSDAFACQAKLKRWIEAGLVTCVHMGT